jgi:GR25 family glycosyltransferase involved in LPS biosynthesis
MENLAEQFLKNRDQKSCIDFIRYIRCGGFFEIGRYFSNFIRKMFPNCVDINEELGIIHYYTGEYELSYNIFKHTLGLRGLDEEKSKRLIFNQHFSIDHIKDNYTSYDIKQVQKIYNNNKIKLSKRITLTITSCKRLDLFTKTINSFIKCCEDWYLIDEWFCVDDNSSEEDRNKMKELYPFINFYFKTFEEKGHPRSMNIIKNHVKTPFVFHMEDDWMFFEKRKYISECMEVLNNNDEIKQCLINKNYAETSPDIDIVGGLFHKTDSGLRYYLHEQTRNQQEELEFNKKYNGGKNCSYWPHFSFRPSLIKTSIFNEIGEFNENTGHFEMEYSYRYVAKNYKSAFLESIYCIHIGRLTSERNDESKLNAYKLNNESQFVNKQLKPTFKTFVINLDRRPDRYEKFKNQIEIKDLKYERFSAVDGENLKPNCQLQHIFENNDYNMRKGMVGCAMSHLKLCIQLLKDDTSDTYCILEDDLDFVPDFMEKVDLCLKQLKNKDWDMLYLGHHLWKEFIDENVYSKTLEPTVQQYNRHDSLRMSMGGTGGYMITKKGAEKLLEFINKTGMTNGIDTVQQKSADDLNIFYCYPHLIYSECYRGENNVDTDIQKNYDSLTLDFNSFLTNELNFYKDNIVQLSIVELPKILNEWKENIPSNIFCHIPQNLDITNILQLINFPYYILESKFIFISKYGNDRLFHRFKVNNEWNIEEALGN